MLISSQTLNLCGNHQQIGEALGELAKPVLPAQLAQSPLWTALQPWRGHTWLFDVAAQLQYAMPSLWTEFEGMAFALGMPVHDLLLWNCRGDLIPKLDFLPDALIEADSSTSLAAASGDTRWLAHQCTASQHARLVKIDFSPHADAPGFTGLYQPGTLPGYGFAANHLGISQVTDSLLPSGQPKIDPGLIRVPRVFLARAILDCPTMDKALHLLGSTSCLGGLHFLLCSAQDHLLWSVETAPGVASYEELNRYYAHSNHMRHADTKARPQHTLPASTARWQAVNEHPPTADKAALFAALRASQTHLPEKTAIFTALFEIKSGKVNLHVEP